MKYLILLAVAGCFFPACSPANDNASAANIELVNNYIKAVENLDYEGMGQYLDENYMGLGPSYGDTINKKDAVENWKANVNSLYKKIHYNRSKSAAVSIPDGDNKDNWVGNWAELTIDYQNGGTVTIWANTNYLVENGKILRSFTFYNEADALRQLGYKIVAPNDEE